MSDLGMRNMESLINDSIVENLIVFGHQKRIRRKVTALGVPSKKVFDKSRKSSIVWRLIYHRSFLSRISTWATKQSNFDWHEIGDGKIDHYFIAVVIIVLQAAVNNVMPNVITSSFHLMQNEFFELPTQIFIFDELNARIFRSLESLRRSF